MLEFFRKYQRSFMIVVAIIVVVTFSFFGTYDAFVSMREKKDVAVGRSIDGSKLYYSEVRHLAGMLGLQGTFRQLMLETGAAEALAQGYFEILKEDWQARLVKARAAKFYSHPVFRELDAKKIWSHLCPGLNEEMDKLLAMEEVGPEFFSVWAKIYSLQEKVSPDWIKRVLAAQLQQASLPVDPRIVNGDFALFGCRTIEDWFGRNFCDLAAQYILNGAALVKKGVSKEEARADYAKCFGDLRGMGISQDEGVRLWGRALSFLRECDCIGEAVILDPLAIEKLAEFAGERSAVDLYRLPQELVFSGAEDQLAFETYVRLACEKGQGGLPEKYLPVDAIAPELTASVYRFRVAKLELASLGSSLSLREVWDWQVDEANWKEMQKQFGWLKSAESSDGRFALLEKLDLKSRKSLDAWSRTQIVLGHPEWIESAFQLAKMEERQVLVSKDWIDGIAVHSAEPFIDLLVRAGGMDGEAREALLCYQDAGALLRVEEVVQVDAKRALTFAEAKEKGRIPVEKFLQQEYRRIRTSAPSLFKTESGEWKKLFDVRETAIRMIFPEKERASLCLKRWVEGALSSLKQGEPLKTDGLWSLERVEEIVERKTEGELMNREAFLLQPGDWSPVYVAPTGEITFFFVKERVASNEPVLEQINFAKESLSSEAKRRFADRVLEIAMQKKALACPLHIEEEKQ